METNGRQPIRIFSAGRCEGLDELREALTGHRDVELAGVADSVADAAGALTSTDVDVVLWATPGSELPEDELAEIHEYTPAPVIGLAGPQASRVLEQALTLDVADAMLLPQPVESVVFAVRRAALTRRRRRTALHEGRTLTVFSPKGGTGKTVLAVNLAVALARCHDRRTLLIDLDLQFGDCAVVLGLKPQKTLYDLVGAAGELDADKLAGFVTHHERGGIDLLAAPARPDEAELLPVERIVALLEVARVAYDEVVIDTSSFLHPPNLAAIDHTDELLLPTTLDLPALKNLRQGLETLALISYPAERVALVLNRADAQAGLSRGEVEAALDMRFRFTVPTERVVPLAVNGGDAVLLAQPRSKFSRAVRDMARELVEGHRTQRRRLALGRA